MSKFVCKNCGFVVEQEGMPDSCPVCGESSFEGGGRPDKRTVKVEAPKAEHAGKAAAPKRNYGAQFREFPGVQKERTDRELEVKIEAIREETRKYVGEQENKKKKADNRGVGLGAGIEIAVVLIGMCASFCRGCIICGNEDWSRGFPDFISTFIVGMIITVVLAVVLGVLFGALGSAGSKKHGRRAEKQKDTSEEEVKRQQEIAKTAVQEYAVAFEQAVREAVQKFVSNKTTEAIGDRILESFFAGIEKAPRDQRQSDIVVGCSYEVYANQVQYQGGVFGFYQNHCSNLAGPVEQAALAQAIAAYLELRVLERYEKDPSGSVPRMESGFVDTALARKTTVTYRAVNANYRSF